MNTLKLIYQTLIQFGKLVGSLPHLAAEVFQQRKRQQVLNELETERLDRIRHPSKYRGE